MKKFLRWVPVVAAMIFAGIEEYSEQKTEDRITALEEKFYSLEKGETNED